MRMRQLILLFSILVILGAVPVVPAQDTSLTQSSIVRDYWPTDGWMNSTLKEQGLNEKLLDEMMDEIQTHAIRIDSISIVRNGYMVFDKYPRTLYDADREHIIHSCTKSFTSALVGIAIAEGYIPGVDSKLVDLLPNRTMDNLDTWKESVTLEHLLTMTSGFEWDEWTEPYSSSENSHYQMYTSGNPVQFYLDLPMAAEPGELWVYSSGASHLLGAIVAETTGVSLLEYAEQKLFTPLGISTADVIWPIDNQGYYYGSGGVYMLPRDMAKFGYLYLNNGTWDGEQVVPSEWVQASAETIIHFSEYEGYSYQWWTYQSEDVDVYSAVGFQGQNIFVVPELDMVVVFTSSVPPYEPYPQTAILFDYIIPAALKELTTQDRIAALLTASLLIAIPLPIISAWLYYKIRTRS
ncbi:MAG: serine hydrolase domain-containing protein [Candidatus Thorarchaeota archaeon]